MDRSDGLIRPVTSALRAALSRRFDGHWELLATAAGHAQSVARTEDRLSANALAQGAIGPAFAPSLVSERVEALAAFSPQALARLAGEWIHPREIGDNPWWTAVWTSSLRHLKLLGVIERRQVETPALSKEIALLWDKADECEISWLHLANDLRSRFAPYEFCRRMAGARIAEPTISAADLEGAPWQMLRLLRGRAALLDRSAVAVLCERARTWAARDPLEGALIAELCADVSPVSVNRICDDLLETIPSITDPRSVIPLAYVLLGRWHPP